MVVVVLDVLAPVFFRSSVLLSTCHCRFALRVPSFVLSSVVFDCSRVSDVFSRLI